MLTLAVAGLGLTVNVLAVGIYSAALRVPDSRDRALQWLVAHAPAGTRIGVLQGYDGDVFFHPPAIGRFRWSACALNHCDAAELFSAQHELLVIADTFLDEINAAGQVMKVADALAAQTGGFPQKPVRIVVPYPTGGSNDVIARLLAQQLQEQWGQAVVVDNKPGAAGNIGAAEVAKAAPDGHTLLLTNINITSMNPALIANMPFDPQKDFAPISLLGTTTLALVVHPSVPANTVIDLVNLAQKEPGRLNYASSGNGSQQHMSAEMFKAMTRTQITHVPYRGAAPAVNDLLAGQVQVSVGVVNQLIPHIRSGRVRALGVTSQSIAQATRIVLAGAAVGSRSQTSVATPWPA
jgi:tripartite-type tricarboxylate transporter receptor subunit TctC